MSKSERLRPVLGRGIDLITPTPAELAALTGLPVTNGDEIRAAVDALRETGVGSVWVRLGPEEGSFLVSPYGSRLVPGPRIEAYVDLIGAGDAMLGAFTHALVRGDSSLDSVLYGHAAAALTIASRGTVRTDLSDELIRSAL